MVVILFRIICTIPSLLLQAQPSTTTTPTFSSYPQPGAYSQAGAAISQPGPAYTQAGYTPGIQPNPGMSKSRYLYCVKVTKLQ